MRILFVCLGNICRSPMAEGVFRNIVELEGRGDRFIIDSAGTGDWHVGSPPDERAQRLLADKGIDISGLRARQFSKHDFSNFDLILAMDKSNYSNILKVGDELSEEQVRLFLSYLPGNELEEVPDPYFGGPEGFEHVFNMVERASREMLRQLSKL